MSKIFLGSRDIEALVKANGTEITYMIGGEPGIGKTAIGRSLAQQLGMDYSYIDMANMSLGDTSMPVVNREIRATEYYPNEVLQLHTGRPVVLVIDEFTKGAREAQNMILPIMYDRRLGSTRLHPESIVIANGNMPDEGLGDKILPHQTDRFALVNMRKPTSDEWLAWAADNDIDPIVMAFVDQYPQVLQSYHDDPNAENGYIFHPKVNRNKVVTPRSLELMSKQIKRRELVSKDAMHAAMVGTVGAAAAADLMAFVSLNHTLPAFTDIVNNPDSIAIPKDIAARILLTYNLVMRVDKDTLPAVMKFVTREKNPLPDELRALFVNKMVSTPSKASFAATHKKIGEMAIALQHMYV